MAEDARDEKTIFLAALDKTTPQERNAFVEGACVGDLELLERVRELLESHDESVGPLDSPPPGLDATIDQSITEKPGMEIGPYKLLQQIGEGGFGVVYMAEQSEPVERRVALKIIKPGMDTRQVIARFEAERQALAMMDHPNIAKVLDAGTTESGRPYFVMELVKGIPITKYCDQQHLMPKERLGLFIPVSQAVQHAHQKGIIHRDLKPSNVLIALYDDRPVPKVIDFGVAKATSQKLTEKTMFTHYGQIVGTLEYMSPEQANLNQLDIDTRSDIYALGVLLYELLTGNTPFERQRLRTAAFDEMMRIIREEEPPRPSLRLSTSESLPSIAANRQIEPKKLSTLVRGELDWIVMKALEKDRSRRYETANAFAADIQRYLNDESVQACPPSAAYRFRKFARRNRAAMVTTGLVAGALIVGMILSTWQAYRATRAERDLAETHSKVQQQRETAVLERDRAVAAEEMAREARDRAETEADEKRQLLYESDMMAALAAWEDGSISTMIDLVQRHRPEPGQEDLRGFEWRYLWRLCGHKLTVPVLEHTDVIMAMCFSPDGKSLATADLGGSVTLWDIATRERRFHQRAYSSPCNTIAFAPNGQTLATLGQGSHGADIKLWDPETGELKKTIGGKWITISGLAFSPDGSCVALSCPNEIRLLDVGKGVFRDKLTLPGRTPTSVRFDPSGQRLAGRYMDGTVRLWDLGSGQSRPLIDADFKSWSIAFSPDGKTLAAGNEKGTVQLWDIESASPVATFGVSTNRVNGIAFSPDGYTIATASPAIELWDVRTEKSIGQVKGGHSCAAMAPDGKTLAVGTIRNTALLYDRFPDEPGTELDGHANAVMCAAVSPEGTLVASGSLGGEIKIWEIVTGRERATLKAPGVLDVTFSPDGNVVAASDWSGSVKLWHLESGRRLSWLKSGGRIAFSVVFSPNGKSVAAGDRDGGIHLWDVATGTLRHPFGKQPGFVTGLAYAVDGRTVAATVDGHGVRLWDGITGELVQELKGGVGPGGRPAFSPDGRVLACGCVGGRIQLWDLGTGDPLVTLEGHAGDRPAVVFSPDGKTLFSNGRGGMIKIWDTQTYRQRANLKGHGVGYGSVAISPDGQTLVSAGFDQKVRLRHASTEEDPQKLAALLRLEDQVRALIGADSEEQKETVEELVAYLTEKDGITPNSRDLALADSVAWGLASAGNFGLAAEAASQIVDLITKHDSPELSGLAHRWRTRHWEYQGRDFAQQNQWEQAAAQFTNVIDVDPERWVVRENRARAYAMLDRWRDAADDLVHMDSKLSLTSYYWCAQAALQLRASDREGYESTCFKAIERLPGRFPNGKARALHLCYLSPDCPIDREQLDNLTNALPDRTAGSLARLVQGMAHYRAGRFQEAVEELTPGGDAWQGPPLRFFRAMSYHHLGDTARAREDLHDGIEVMLRKGQTTSGAWPSYLPDRWIVRCVVDVVRCEAQETILGPEFPHLNRAYELTAAADNSEAIEAYSQAIQLHPDDCLPWAGRGHLHALHSRWGEAAADFRRAAQLSPTVAKRWAQAAPLLVLAGNEGEYRQHCQEMINHFGASGNLSETNDTCNSCLLLPDVFDPTKLPLELGTRALDDGSASNWYQAWGPITHALAAYREGNAAKAVEWVRNCQETQAYANKPYMHAKLLPVLAMAQHQLKQSQDAQKALTEATDLIDTHMPKLATGELGHNWHNWITAEILRREATALINAPVAETRVDVGDEAGSESQ